MTEAELTRRWRRRRDGLVVTTRTRRPAEPSHEWVLATKPNGNTYWVTWDGLGRKYTEITGT